MAAMPTEQVRGDFPFLDSDWSLTQSDLQVAERVLAELGRGTVWKLGGNLRGGAWPGRSLRRRRWFKDDQIRVRLERTFDSPEDRKYSIERVIVGGFGLWRRLSSHVVAAELDATQIHNAVTIDRHVRVLMEDG